MKQVRRLNLGPWRRVVRLAFSGSIAVLLLAGLVWGLHDVVSLQAAPSAVSLHVDDATGHDVPSCGPAVAPCKTISYALVNQADDDDSILITTGIFSDNLTVDSLSLTFRGGFTISGTEWVKGTGPTIIDGGGADRVFLIQDSTAVLEGLTIRGGVAAAGGGGAQIKRSTVSFSDTVISGNKVTGGDGGGLAAFEDSVVVLAGVVISDNQVAATATSGRAGGLLVASGSEATLTDVSVAGNTARAGGGGVFASGLQTTVSISRSRIFSNTTGGAPSGGGGGLEVSQGTLVLADSTVAGNEAAGSQGGGLLASGGSVVSVLRSRFADNLAAEQGGALAAVGSTVSISTALVTGNETGSGIANVLAISDTAVTLANSTVAANNPLGDQAVMLWTGSLEVANTIMWNNGPNLASGPACPACITVTYSDIQGGWSGYTNKNTDPLFIGGGNYKLGLGSPCVDAGTNAGALAHDLDGESRLLDGDGDGVATVDIGAYEFRLHRVLLPLTIRGTTPDW